MEKVKEIAKALNILPKLHLGNKLEGGGVQSTGVHRVKFIAEPTVVMGRNHKTGQPQKELRFLVEESGQRYRWNVPILRDGQPNYLIERLMNIEVGNEYILEMMRRGTINYIDVRKPDETPREPPEEQEEAEEDETGVGQGE